MPLVLVEPGAHQLGGHHHRTLTALATAHGRAVVAAPYGIASETRAALLTAGARVTGPAGVAPAVYAAAGPPPRRWPWPGGGRSPPVAGPRPYAASRTRSRWSPAA
ncbi:hypothetical protein ABZ599_16740 [Streptomyces misionensis]|uniref:hypothetical protein n=1 Tax=Streptomyces misionensis TaxID=67331 RepID=UPI0033E6B07A